MKLKEDLRLQRAMGGGVLLEREATPLSIMKSLPDIGFVAGGKWLYRWGYFIQQSNFLLFLPVALILCANCLQALV